MPAFFFRGQSHTLASALREALECDDDETDEFVSCTQPHPLDDHLEVYAPDARAVREALLRVKACIRDTRGRLTPR